MTWTRFEPLIGINTWDEVVECGLEDATREETDAICRLGFYGKLVSAESIAALAKGERYDSGGALRLLYKGVDGTTTKTFETREEMREFIAGFAAEMRDAGEDGFGTDYGNWTLEGATMSDLGLGR